MSIDFVFWRKQDNNSISANIDMPTLKIDPRIDHTKIHTVDSLCRHLLHNCNFTNFAYLSNCTAIDRVTLSTIATCKLIVSNHIMSFESFWTINIVRKFSYTSTLLQAITINFSPIIIHITYLFLGLKKPLIWLCSIMKNSRISLKYGIWWTPSTDSWFHYSLMWYHFWCQFLQCSFRLDCDKGNKF